MGVAAARVRDYLRRWVCVTWSMSGAAVFGIVASPEFVSPSQSLIRLQHCRLPLRTMVKAKVLKEAKNAKSHVKARINYLQCAASYLQTIAVQHGHHTASSNTDRISDEISEKSTAQSMPGISNNKTNAKSTPTCQHPDKGFLTNLSRACLSQMRGISLKTQTRLPVPVKRSFCKRCDTLLAQGVNCEHEVRNASRGRKKPWADVLVIRCLVCGAEKNFPQTDRRSRKLTERKIQPGRQKLATQQQGQVDPP